MFGGDVMRRLYKILVCGMLIWLLGGMSILMAAPLVEIDTSDTSKGLVHVTYQGTTSKRLKVMIEKGDKKYTYDLDEQGKRESFPLQMGSGIYQIKCLQNVQGQSYALIESESLEVKLDSEEGVYLNAIQNINWSKDSQPIIYAASLAKQVKEYSKKMSTLYSYMVGGTYTYDYDKLATLATGYIPNIDATYKDKTGICYDFSALYSAMLRSLGIPAKLVKGYATTAEGYHAWNEVYDFNKKQWLIVDTTYDLQVNKVKVKVKMIKEAKDYQKVNEY